MYNVSVIFQDWVSFNIIKTELSTKNLNRYNANKVQDIFLQRIIEFFLPRVSENLSFKEISITLKYFDLCTSLKG